MADLTKKTNPWRWTDKDKACFQEFRKKIPSTKCLGLRRPKGEITLEKVSGLPKLVLVPYMC